MKRCPFLPTSVNNGKISSNMCNSNCALYLGGYCAFAILAQKAMSDATSQKESEHN